MSRAGHISADIFSRMRAFESPEVIDINSPIQQEQQQQQQQQQRTVANKQSSGLLSDAAAANRVEESALGNGRGMMSSSPPPPPPTVQMDAEGLILPKKLVNPCLESTDRKELHRELKFNNKVGKSVLNQKSELQRVYEKQKERQQQYAPEHASEGLKDELNRAMMERAQKHELPRLTSEQSDEDRQYVNPEYLNVRAKLRTGQRADLK